MFLLLFTSAVRIAAAQNGAVAVESPQVPFLSARLKAMTYPVLVHKVADSGVRRHRCDRDEIEARDPSASRRTGFT
jgi:hypothetical protein